MGKGLSPHLPKTTPLGVMMIIPCANRSGIKTVLVLIIKPSNKVELYPGLHSYEGHAKCAAYAIGRVTAPIDAEVTREAYLASTPLV